MKNHIKTGDPKTLSKREDVGPAPVRSFASALSHHLAESDMFRPKVGEKILVSGDACKGYGTGTSDSKNAVIVLGKGDLTSKGDGTTIFVKGDTGNISGPKRDDKVVIKGK
jgi:hypothetical protein